MLFALFSKLWLARRSMVVGLLASLALTLAFAGDPQAAPKKKSGRAWLGVALKSGPAGGVLVDFVFKTSPAAKVGLKKDDMLLRADGVLLDKPADLVAHVRRHKPGMVIKLKLRRGGRDRTVSVTLARHPGKDKLMRLLHVGNKAYELKGLTKVQGKVPKAIKELKGRVVLIDFFASWCVGCRALTPQLTKWHNKYGNKGLTLLGITSDGKKQAAKTVKDWKIPYAVASDATQQTAADYHVGAIPALFLVDRKGVIREVLIGYDPTRRAATEKLIKKLIAER